MDWQETLNTVNKLKDLFIERSEIYAVQSKEDAAISFGKPVDYYYDLSYSEWGFVSERYHELLNCMCRDIEYVEEYCGKDLMTVPCCEWMGIYHQWLKSLV
jgi:hypothetical protein